MREGCKDARWKLIGGSAEIAASFRRTPTSVFRKMHHWRLRDKAERAKPMRLVVACCSVTIAIALSGCSSGTRKSTTADLPSSVDSGVGSQYGNYAAQTAGETRGPDGERCVVFDWDRPLVKGQAVRVRSASCESKDVPGRMVSRELSRTVIPMSKSNLNGGQEQARQ